MQNPDDKTKSGTRPLGTSLGAAGGAVGGAALGTIVAGPLGAAVGGAIGAATGAMAGQAVEAAIVPDKEDAYWREHSVKGDRPYAEYGPAYRYGWESRARMSGRSFEQVEGELAGGWDKAKGDSKLTWDKAKAATRDAWHRVERAMPGDADGDGR